ncbi:MAG TPA: hypothetical protein VLZ53_00115, partial [Devosia sp.]|nr:hypothetical protein [Devosia sp.]
MKMFILKFLEFEKLVQTSSRTILGGRSIRQFSHRGVARCRSQTGANPSASGDTATGATGMLERQSPMLQQ